MNHYYFYIFILIKVLLIINSVVKIKGIEICCPFNSWLIEISYSLIDKDRRYECLYKQFDGNFRRNFNDFNIIGKSQPLYGHFLFQTNLPSMILSNCKNPIYKRYSHKETTHFPILKDVTCIMNTGNDLFTLTCPLENTSNIYPTDSNIELVSFVHKCCPILTYYERKEQRCLPNNYSMNLLDSKDNQRIFIYRKDSFHCPKNKLLVEYYINNNAFASYQETIAKHPQVMDLTIGEKHFLTSEYCLEPLLIDQEININSRNQYLHSIKEDQSNPQEKYLVRVCQDDGDHVCQTMPCIRRCCNDDREVVAKGNVSFYCKSQNDILSSFQSFQSLNTSAYFLKPKVFGLWRGLECRKYRLDPDIYEDEVHEINVYDGSILIASSQKLYTNQEYCLERIHVNDSKLYTFLCFNTEIVKTDRIRFKLYTIGLLISCLFYAITLVVYFIVARLRNLPGKIQICLISSLLFAYISIALGQLMPTSNDQLCRISGFFVYFCLMAAFFWMNVMCFDIWQTFGSAKARKIKQSKQHKRFLLYSLYGWGLPSLLTTLTLLLTQASWISEAMRPQFGHGRCWFTYGHAGISNLVFFSGPIGILFVVNLILFILTLRYCNQVRREICQMQSSNQQNNSAVKRSFLIDKGRFVMNTKLFVVMGINWFLELLSIIFYDHKQIFFWAISDSFNVLLGVFVFLIFVFKKSIWIDILTILGLRKPFKKMATVIQPALHSQPLSAEQQTITNANDSLLVADIEK